jgi:hypothetical protein
MIERAITGSEKKSPITGSTINPAKAIIRAKGNNMNPTILLEIFSRKQSILFMIKSLHSIQFILYLKQKSNDINITTNFQFAISLF